MNHFELQIVRSKEVKRVVAADRKRKFPRTIQHSEIRAPDDLECFIDLALGARFYRNVMESGLVNFEWVLLLRFPDVDGNSVAIIDVDGKSSPRVGRRRA